MEDNNGQSKGSVVVGIVAVLFSIGAGIYLLQTESASEDATIFDAIMHGMGAYFIARGLWMVRSLVR